MEILLRLGEVDGFASHRASPFTQEIGYVWTSIQAISLQR